MTSLARTASRRARSVATVIGVATISVGPLAVNAQPAASAAAAAVAAARVSLQQFRDLRWLEGTWRAQMPNGKYFYERYTRVNDSTIRIIHFPDSTLATPGEEEMIALRGGTVRHGRAVVIRLDAGGVAFAAPPKTTPDFTFTPASAGWTATIHHGPDQSGAPRQTVYRMQRYAAPAPQPAVEREAVRRAVLDYVEGFYEGDTVKLARAMWPEVRKYGYSRDAATGAYQGMAMQYPSGFMNFANGVRAGRTKTPANAPKDVVIFDVQDQTASAKLTAWWGTDYLLLAKDKGRWMITHVLWQSPPPR